MLYFLGCAHHAGTAGTNSRMCYTEEEAESRRNLSLELRFQSPAVFILNIIILYVIYIKILYILYIIYKLCIIYTIYYMNVLFI